MAKQNQNFNLGFALDELGADIKKAGWETLEIGANIIMADMKSRIHNVSGDLAASITARPNKSHTKIIISANAKNKKGKMYGRLVEFWPGREHPFMYPAYDAHSKQIREDIIESIREAIRKHAVS